MGPNRAERLRDPAELLAVAEPLEPRTTHLVDALLGQPARHRHISVVRDPSGTITGALVVSRLCLDRWFAFPLVLDPAAAPHVGRAIDRSKAWLVLGFAADVDAVEDHVQRKVGRLDREHTALDVVNTDAFDLAPDDRIRLAGAGDLDALFALYKGYELDYLPSLRRLRRDLARDVARERILVLEDGGRFVGAIRMEAGTRRFQHWSHQTVDPEFRGRRIGVELGVAGLLHSRACGVWASWARHPANPVPTGTGEGPLEIRDVRIDADVLSHIRLRRRLPAARKAWRALEILEGRRRRRPKEAIDEARQARGRDRYPGRDPVAAFEEERRADAARRQAAP